ncbi:MAG: hypothetical protein HYY84_16425 [Deltaproteobacteria bacterium]|nr:hypothetical protein [Deltaproteobacteria bacterium]
MKTRLAAIVLFASFACGMETEGDVLTQDMGTDSSGLKQSAPQPEVVRIPIAIVNPQANAGLDPSGVGYPGWSHGDWGRGYFETYIDYDETLNSNVFNIVTYNRETTGRGEYTMLQEVRLESMSAAAQLALSEGYPIECRAEQNVWHAVTEEQGNLEMQVYAFNQGGDTIDWCRKVLEVQNRWQTTTCGPIATPGIQSIYLIFSCRSSIHCKIDKVKCDVVKRAGFERFKPNGVVALPFDLSQM